MIEVIKSVKELRDALVDGYRECLSIPSEWEVTVCQGNGEYILLSHHHSEYIDPSNGKTIHTFEGTSEEEIDMWAEAAEWDRSVVCGDSVEDDIKDAMVEAFEENELEYIIKSLS